MNNCPPISFLLLAVCFQFTSCNNYCYSLDHERPQRRHFSDATSYAYVRGAEFGRQYAAPFCRPSKLWILARHGTSLYGNGTMEAIDELKMLRNEVVANSQRPSASQPSNESLCPEDLKLIQYWNLDKNITSEHSNFLTIQGWNDMKSLAKSFKRIFPDLLGRGYNTEQFTFRFTDEQYTEASYKAFVEGLFEKDAHISTSTRSISDSPAWLEKFEPPNEYVEEVTNFKKSTIFLRMVSDISAKLGYNYPLSLRNIFLMWDLCRYEQAWFMDSQSAWCAPFTLSDHEILEYLNDLESQYQVGYSSDFNTNVPCNALEDMIRHLEGSTNPRVSASFSHSSVIQLLLVALGAYKDDVLMTSLNYNMLKERKWRLSRLTPFAANIVAVKYDCTWDKRDPVPKVKFFLNQRPIKLPWCSIDLCRVEDIISQYKAFCKYGYNSADKKYSTFNLIFFTIFALFIKF